ncbi:GDSL-type esterase/lipase family protein [Hymenobacter negativus]|uniref:GDSL family lipase n=1 Tax=Hymenobacter negativus TaxID=2795026 RepID=A0ABS3QHB0_9BACT|nr:GDSL-type esterase/lipase family protein [Hymenobacter negativus]MBO2010506.1 GDSL family lipase [Hymenobacter negativus]
MQWYQEEIARLKELPVASTKSRPRVVFYGSSTFTRWPELARCFPWVETVNLGFGGSTLAACAWFFQQLVPQQQPDALLIYAGDNDLGDGRTAEEVVLFYDHLLASVRATLGQIPVVFVSIKLSPARQHLRPSIDYANATIRQRIAGAGPNSYYLDINPGMVDGRGYPRPALFEADGLHLSPEGYAVWQQKIGAALMHLYPSTP